jgi:splicing factor U2AF subunit
MVPNMGVLGAGGSNQQQTRHARRVYVGGITEAHGTEQDISSFFETTLRSCLSDKDKPPEGSPLIGRVYLHAERGFAFLEFPSVQMTSACMQLDRLVWKGTPLKIKRPNDYQPHKLPPASMNAPLITLDVTKLEFGGGPAAQAEHRVYIGGLPADTTEADLKPIFEQFGVIDKFDLVPDLQNPALCRGYCFVDYHDPADAPKAIEALHSKPFGRMQGPLKVQFANVGARQTRQQQVMPLQLQMPSIQVPAPAFNAEDAIAAALAMTRAPAPSMAMGTAPPNLSMGFAPSAMGSVPSLLGSYPGQSIPAATGTTTIAGQAATVVAGAGGSALAQSKVIVLMNMVPLDELADDALYSELVDEISEECRKFGNLLACVVPRDGAGRGKVYLHYEHESMASTALRLLKGRRFGDAVVDAQFYDQDSFHRGEYQ